MVSLQHPGNSTRPKSLFCKTLITAASRLCMSRSRTIAVIGLGYVGLPVATAFGRAGFKAIGFDVNGERIDELRQATDRTREVSAEDIGTSGIAFTDAASDLQAADFFIVTVPTPIDSADVNPDLSMPCSTHREPWAAPSNAATSSSTN